MHFGAIVTILAGAAFPMTVAADDGPISGDASLRSQPKDEPGSSTKAHRTKFVPCIGRGYLSYSYPAFDSCRCGADCCYHPGDYYFGGKSYKRQWSRFWLRAHLGKGSMLDRYPCECRYPTAGRPYYSTVPAKRRLGK